MTTSPANAASKQAITEAAEFIFKSERAGGSQINGCQAVSIYNSGTVDIFAHVNGFHANPTGSGSTAPPSAYDYDGDNTLEYARIPSGTSITFEITDATLLGTQIDWIIVKADPADTGSIDWTVTKRR